MEPKLSRLSVYPKTTNSLKIEFPPNTKAGPDWLGFFCALLLAKTMLLKV
jgi:hypothetical protein